MSLAHTSQLRVLAERIRQLKPTSAPGVLTSRTTGGVSRRPTVKAGVATKTTTTTTVVPRWG
jgi:hypothetical protein